MFEKEALILRDYFLKYQTEESFYVKKEKRTSNLCYDFDEIVYAIIKDDSELNLNKENYKKFYTDDQTNVYFINRSNVKMKEVDYIHKLNNSHKDLFDSFLESQSDADKNEGMVSLNDDAVFGVILDGKIVSVASTWNWGEYLADIGILTDSNYRKRGLSKLVVQTLISNVDKIFVYRCDTKNIGSNRLAQSIGFEKKGEITTLKED